MSRGERSRPTPARTEQARERDRLERERRRAAAAQSAEQPDPEPAPSEPSDPKGTHEAPRQPAERPAPEPPARQPPANSRPPTSTPPAPLAAGGPHSRVPTPDGAPATDPAADDWLVPPVPLDEFTAAHRARRRRGRPGRVPTRLASLVAIVAVAVAVVLLVVSLRPGHRRTLAAPKVIRVLIPEGETRAQIEEIAKRDGLSGSYRGASRRSSLVSLKAYGAPHGTPNLEGFLFPATYDMDAGAPASLLVEKQLVAFGENFGHEEVTRARELHVTPYQLLIVASMVEREAQIPGDRAKIAAVIYNRLRANMPLGIDATIYYAVELAKRIPTYTGELSQAQLQIDSPYNTRLHRGLPPTPISNPGLASIRAAAHPSHVGYLYYVAGADGCGEQVFSDAAAEFEADVAAYRAAVKRNGGQPPTCTHK